LCSNIHVNINNSAVIPTSFNVRCVKVAAYCHINPLFIWSLVIVGIPQKFSGLCVDRTECDSMPAQWKIISCL
jgi:hypothetical protein